MKKLFKIGRYIAANAVFCFCLYEALYNGSTGFGNIVIFLTYLMLALSCVLLIPAVADAYTKQATEPLIRSVPIAVDAIYDLTIVGILIFHGWWFTGIAYLLHTIIGNIAIELLRVLSQKHLTDLLSQPNA